MNTCHKIDRSSNLHALSVRERLQHYILNWLVISRYKMVHHGIPKETTVRCLMKIENFLKRLHLLAS